MPTKDRRSLPELGPRGEGWFAVQVILLAAVGLAGAVGPNWSGPARVAGVVAGAIFIVVGGVQAVRGVVDLRENLTIFPKPLAGARLVEEGAYRRVRHPPGSSA